MLSHQQVDRYHLMERIGSVSYIMKGDIKSSFIFLTEKGNIIFFETACMLCYVVLSNFENENSSINFSISTDTSIQNVCYDGVIAYNYSITYKHNIQHTNFQGLK